MVVLTQPVRALSERTGSLDHDIRAVVLRFGAAQSRSSAELAAVIDQNFRHADPLHEPLKVADERLQSRLEELCETLRVKY